MKILILLPILASLAVAPAFGQKKKSPSKHLRVIAVGELPAWAQKMKKKVRVGNEYTAEEAPPANVSIPRKDMEPLVQNLGLGKMSGFIPYSSKAKSLGFYRGKEPKGKPWVKLPLKGKAKFNLALLFSPHKKVDWKEPQSLVLPDDLEALPLHHARFTNVSEKKIFIRIGGRQAFAIAPGQTRVAELKPGSTFAKIGYKPTQGEMEFLHQNNIKMMKNHRMHWVFWKSKEQKEVRMTVIHEGTPTPPKPPAKKKKAAPAPATTQ